MTLEKDERKIVLALVCVVTIILLFILISYFANQDKIMKNEQNNSEYNNKNQDLTPLLDTEVIDIVTPLRDAYESHFYNILPSNDSNETIVAPLVTAVHKVVNQRQWSQILNSYSDLTKSDLYADIENRLSRSFGTGIFSHKAGTNLVQEQRDYIHTLPA